MGTAPHDGTGFVIRRIALEDQTVTLVAEGSRPSSCCPSCGAASTAVHDRYRRRPVDLPWRGHTVRLVLTVRRFRCPTTACPRATFAEEFGAALPRYARRTLPARGLLLRFALAAGGEAGARLAHASGLPTSPDTLLRLLRQEVAGVTATPRVLGIDDLALRRGRTYATLFVDLETHRPIDLLHGRDAALVAPWLREHPGVEIVVRDRSEAYAQGVKEGAPAAQQVADRFHLLQKASAALDELLHSRRRRVEIATAGAPTPAPDTTPAVVPPPRSLRKQRQVAQRAARVARWEHVRELGAGGMSLRGIARELGLHRKTVRRLLATPAPPRNQIVHPRPGGLSSPLLQPYVPYLQDRWQQGCHNVSQLYRELVALGYPGSRSLLHQALGRWRPPRPPPRRGQGRPRRRSVRWLCLRPPDQLPPEEREALDRVLAEDPELATGYALLQRFRVLVTARDLGALDGWLRDAQQSGLPSFISLATGIAADRAPVAAALTLPWSTGPVEGQVHRVKLIKRQGYGRAKLDLLRRRVLAA